MMLYKSTYFNKYAIVFAVFIKNSGKSWQLSIWLPISPHVNALQRRYRRGELTRVRNGVYVDSHDLLSHIDITRDHAEMTRTPASAGSLIDILKSRHGILLAQRPDKRPGLIQKRAQPGRRDVFCATGAG